MNCKKTHTWGGIGTDQCDMITGGRYGVSLFGKMGGLYTSLWVDRKEAARLLRGLRRAGIKVKTTKFDN